MTPARKPAFPNRLKLRMLHILLFLPSLATASQLPEHMVGQYQLETSEGFNDFMHEVGVSWFTRKVSFCQT